MSSLTPLAPSHLRWNLRPAPQVVNDSRYQADISGCCRGASSSSPARNPVPQQVISHGSRRGPIVSDDGQAIVRHGEIADVSHMTQPDLRFEAPIGVDVKGEMRSCVETPGSVDFFGTRSPA